MMPKLREFALLSVIAVAILLLTGCGKKDNPILAKVGSDEITTQDLNDIFTRSQSRFLSFDDELQNRRQILDSLIIQQLLIQAAYQKNFDANEEVNRIVLSNTDRFLLDILYQREIADKIKITDDEIRDMYDKLEYKTKASNILLRSEDTARMVLDSLKNGANFENMAVQYSIDPSAAKNRGDMGFFIVGKTDPVFEEQVAKLNPGELSEPFETKYGWHIVKVVDRQPNELRKSFDEMKGTIRTALENYKASKLMDTFRAELQKKYPIKVETATCDYLMNKRSSLYPPQLLASLPKNDFDASQLERDEREMVLATWDGGQITLGQYLSTIRSLRRQIPDLPAPSFDQYDSLAAFLFQVNAGLILAQEARRGGYENDPEFKRKIKKFKELAMADMMENDSIPQPPPPDEGEMRQYYDDHPEEFMIPPKIHVFEILLSDPVMAQQYAVKMKGVERFKSLADQLTERPGKRGTGGDMGNIDQRTYPDIYMAVDKGIVGDILGPIQIGGKYGLYYIADKIPSEQRDFVAVKQLIKDRLEKQRKRKAFEDWVEQRKKEVNIKIYENNLRTTVDQSKYAQPDTTRG